MSPRVDTRAQFEGGTDCGTCRRCGLCSPRLCFSGQALASSLGCREAEVAKFLPGDDLVPQPKFRRPTPSPSKLPFPRSGLGLSS